MPDGFELHSRREWRAKPPKNDPVRRSAGTVNTVYIHWPASPGHLRTTEDIDEILKVPEQEASDCYFPDELVAELDALNKRLTNPNARIDTRAEEAAFMRQIQAFHQNTRGWNDFAYNYAMFLSGHVWAGRTYKVVPASQAPHNTTGISICCMIGTQDTVSRAMRENLRDFVRWSEKYSAHDLSVKGHRQVNPTTCPGDRLQSLVPSLSRL